MSATPDPRHAIRIREFVDADTDSVVSLWESCGLTRPWNDPRADIERSREAGTLLVAEDRAAGCDAPGILGTVMFGYDGHRGWMYYLASDPGHRGEGLGRALVAAAERRLEALGCPKAQLMVRGGNEIAIGFYESLGYERNDVLVLGKRLIED